MANEQRNEWVARQVARFQPGDLDAGLEIIRRALRRIQSAEEPSGGT